MLTDPRRLVVLGQLALDENEVTLFINLSVLIEDPGQATTHISYIILFLIYDQRNLIKNDRSDPAIEISPFNPKTIVLDGWIDGNNLSIILVPFSSCFLLSMWVMDEIRQALFLGLLRLSLFLLIWSTKHDFLIREAQRQFYSWVLGTRI
jgi:hypothetical protein